ncbi:unnamed protein product [Anisakis simplex]|uniref:ANF_receptor domain-containing protein n=1 Tax=Anisakis simplex TaxID=6269 RepID=A0A0M3K5V7_ANISI|nr:unnamed protein product [Anisakis simplex]
MLVSSWLKIVLIGGVFAFVRRAEVKKNGHQVNIRIGHLLKNNSALAHEPDVLRLCAKELALRSILPANFTLEVFTMSSCEAFNGVEHAAFMHYKRSTTVYFGPGCNDEMLVIGRLASRWNVPIIAHTSGHDALANRHIFTTLGSVALTSAIEMAKATHTFIQLNRWKQVAIVRSSEDYERLSVYSLANVLKGSQISVNIQLEVNSMATVDDLLASNILKTLKRSARIIIVELGMDLDTVTNFMIAVHRCGMKTEEFVYILPWLAHVSFKHYLFHVNDYYPWEASGVDKHEVKAAFENTIIITAHGYDHKLVNEFQLKFAQETGILCSHYASITYMSLYDALYLYGLALRDAFDETDSEHVYLNGSFLWQKMINRQFIGMSGHVLTNKKAIRVPSYAIYHVSNGTVRVVQQMKATLRGDCSRADDDEEDCFEHVPHELINDYWPSNDGKLPEDEPYCGFDASLCDYTNVFVLAAIIACFTISAPVTYLVYLREREKRLYDMTWRIPRESVRLVDDSRAVSSLYFKD